MNLTQQRTWKLTNVVCQRRPQMAMPDLAPSWLVQLESTEFPEIVVVEAVEHARDEIEAAWFAFQTRNIPDNWVVTAVEKA